MTTRCLIDTNVLIDYLDSNASPELIANVEQALVVGSVVSVITTGNAFTLGCRPASADLTAYAES
ncbi:hypothetical protein [Propionivibrio sp.]|uniref:hypothetical protein n=1 Tax=Propionivibrio sp. TaxID=2212460 RepID=UPI003BF44629